MLGVRIPLGAMLGAVAIVAVGAIASGVRYRTLDFERFVVVVVAVWLFVVVWPSEEHRHALRSQVDAEGHHWLPFALIPSIAGVATVLAIALLVSGAALLGTSADLDEARTERDLLRPLLQSLAIENRATYLIANLVCEQSADPTCAEQLVAAARRDATRQVGP